MLGKTHMAAGITASLILVMPDTLSECAVAAAGGMLGGMIPDFDQRDEDCRKSALEDVAITLVLIAVLLGVDYFVKFGFMDFLVNNVSPYFVVGLTALAVLLILGAATKHRSLTHSFAFLAAVSVSSYAVCPVIVLPLAAGMTSHLLLDLFNKRGMMLFWPFKKEICLGVCVSNGKANDVVGSIFAVASIVLGVFAAGMALPNSGDLSSTFAIAGDEAFLGMSNLFWYLVGVNILTFLMRFALEAYSSLSSFPSDAVEEAFTWVINILAFAGGAFAMFIAFVLDVLAARSNGKKGLVRSGDDSNSLLLVISASLCVVWGVVVLLATSAVDFSTEREIDFSPAAHIPAIAYLVAVNVLAFVLFFMDRSSDRRKFHPAEFALMALALAGGAFGALLAMFITNSKRYQIHFQYGIPIILAVDVLIVAMLLVAGRI